MASSETHGLIRAVPNVLSGLRLGLAVAFPFADGLARPWMLAAAGVSDLLDGWIARRFSVTSWVGGLLDAIADKAFVVAALGTLLVEGRISWGGAVLLVVRDLVVAVAVTYGAAKEQWRAFRHMGSRWWGRLTTALLFPYFFLVFALPEATLPLTALYTAAAASSVLAALDYGTRFVRAVVNLRRGRDPLA